MADYFAGITTPFSAETSLDDGFFADIPMPGGPQPASTDFFSDIPTPQSAQMDDGYVAFEDIEPPQTAQPIRSAALNIPGNVKMIEKPGIERGFFDKVGEAWRRGGEAVGADIAVGRGIVGAPETGGPLQIITDPVAAATEAFQDLTPDDMQRLEPLISKQAALQRIDELDPVEGRNWLSKGVIEASRMLGGMWETIKPAWDDALAGAGIGAAVSGGAATLPGAMYGATVGRAKEWYFQGLGQMYKRMAGEGIDPEISKNVAMGAAVPYAAIEFFFTQMPFLKAVFKSTGKVPAKVLSKGAMSIAAHIIAQHGIQVLGEVSEEGAQQITDDVAFNIGAYFDSLKTSRDRKSLSAKEVLMNSVDTMIRSALPIALTMAPSVGYRTVEAAADYHLMKSRDGGKIEGVLGRMKEDFGEQAVQRLDDSNVLVTLPSGKLLQVQIVASSTELASQDQDAWLDSVRTSRPGAAEVVDAALISADNDKAEAIKILRADGYGERGVTSTDVITTDEQGNQITVDALIQLVEGRATAGTLAHEQWHALKALAGVTAKEEAMLKQAFETEEAQAVAFGHLADQHPIMAKIGKVVRAILRIFQRDATETPDQILERLKGEMILRLQEPAERVAEESAFTSPTSAAPQAATPVADSTIDKPVEEAFTSPTSAAPQAATPMADSAIDKPVEAVMEQTELDIPPISQPEAKGAKEAPVKAPSALDPITDLKSMKDQPWYDADIDVTYSGEVYNVTAGKYTEGLNRQRNALSALIACLEG